MARYGRLLTGAEWENIWAPLPNSPKRPCSGRPRADDCKVVQMRKQLRVLISEPNVMYCNLIRKAFEAVRNRFQIVACAQSTIEITTAIAEARPDVAVISANLQDGHLAGFQILPQIRKVSPGTRTLIVLESSDRELVIEAFRIGADGVFCRNQGFELLCRSVEAVSRGQIWANTDELRYVLDAFANFSKRRKLDSGDHQQPG